MPDFDRPGLSQDGERPAEDEDEENDEGPVLKAADRRDQEPLRPERLLVRGLDTCPAR